MQFKRYFERKVIITKTQGHKIVDTSGFSKTRHPEKISVISCNRKFQQFWSKFIDLDQQKFNKNKERKKKTVKKIFASNFSYENWSHFKVVGQGNKISNFAYIKILSWNAQIT